MHLDKDTAISSYIKSSPKIMEFIKHTCLIIFSGNTLISIIINLPNNLKKAVIS